MKTRTPLDRKGAIRGVTPWLALLACLIPCPAPAVDSAETIRASVIEKIARFIEWPAFDNERFTLCTVVDTSLMAALTGYYETATLAGKPVTLVTFKKHSPPPYCQAIYLGEKDMDAVDTVLQATRNQPVLLVAEKEDAVSQGVHVDFFTSADRLHLEVNRRALESSGFKVSYHLLKVARVVE